MARRRIGITIIDRLDLFGLNEAEAGVVMSTIYKSKAISDQFSYKNGGLITGVILDLHEPNPNPDGPEPATTAGMSGIQGPLKNLPAYWGGGTYAQALAGTSKSLIRHDGFAKFEYGKIAGFDIEGEKLTTTGAGISGVEGVDRKNPAFWAGGTYAQALAGTSKALIRHDGSVKFKDADIEGRVIVEQSAGGKILMDATGLQIYNSLGGMNIRFGIKDGYSVMEYYDNEGNMLYDLGPNGITKLEVREEKWILTKLVFLGLSINAVLTNETAKEKYKTPGQQTETSYYKYVSKIVGGVNQNAGEDGRIFNNNSLLSGYIPAGVYMTKTVGMQKEYLTDETRARIYPPGINVSNEAVYDKSPLLFVQLRTYSFGVIDTTANAYWNTSFVEI